MYVQRKEISRRCFLSIVCILGTSNTSNTATPLPVKATRGFLRVFRDVKEGNSWEDFRFGSSELYTDV